MKSTLLLNAWRNACCGNSTPAARIFNGNPRLPVLSHRFDHRVGIITPEIIVVALRAGLLSAQCNSVVERVQGLLINVHVELKFLTLA
jgi:hypothetical protein